MSSTGAYKGSVSRQLSVRIVKATGMGPGSGGGNDVTSGGGREPYVVVEVDEPSQRFRTTAGEGDDNVMEWNQDCLL